MQLINILCINALEKNTSQIIDENVFLDDDPEFYEEVSPEHQLKLSPQQNENAQLFKRKSKPQVTLKRTKNTSELFVIKEAIDEEN